MQTGRREHWERIYHDRQPDELTFAHVLVHESVHGFIHRFRTPATVPSASPTTACSTVWR